MTRIRVDFAIVGGGIAGLWMRAVLRQLGFSVVLVESRALGIGQTLAAQGIVHGGLKDALNTQLTASETTAAMPARWRSLLSEQDSAPATRADRTLHDPAMLRGLPVLSDAYYVFATAGTGNGQLGLLVHRSVLGRVEQLFPSAYPAWLADARFAGPAYRLPDFALDTRALLQRLAFGHPQVDSQSTLLHADVCSIRVDTTHAHLHLLARAAAGAGVEIELQAQRLLLCAGAGTAQLLELAGRAAPAMQLRPLHQVWARRPLVAPSALPRPAQSQQINASHSSLPAVFAHCVSSVGSTEPRLTITAHSSTRGTVWSLGGAIATQGVARSQTQQIEFARGELAECLPWLDTADLQFASAVIDRAELRTPAGARPDQACVHYSEGIFTCWPSKLSLTPDMADRVLALIQAQALQPRTDANLDTLAHCSAPTLAAPRWEQLAWN